MSTSAQPTKFAGNAKTPQEVRDIISLVKMGESKNEAYALAANQSLEVMSGYVFWLTSEQSNGQFPQRDKDAMAITRAFIKSLKKYSSEPGGGAYDNTKTAEKLDKLKKALHEIMKENTLAPLAMDVAASKRGALEAGLLTIGTLKQVYAENLETRRSDIVLNAAIAYWVGEYVRLRFEQSAQFARASLADLKEASNITRTALMELSPKEAGPLAIDDFYTAENIRNAFEESFRR